METIKVNMNPNPLDVQTIHASQNDTEARQWGFELHNNGELIDTSDVTDQITFKSYEGGTEEILPTNGSVPTTAPFKGDIKYPDATRNDQEFLYRQSPTEEDGNAKIKSLYGNTLVWNQLVQNGNFESSSGWTGNNASVSIANNKCNVTVTVAHNSSALRNVAVNGISGHKYLGIMTVTSSKATACAFHLSGYSSNAVPVSANVRTVVYGILTPPSNTGGAYFYINRNAQLSVNDTVVVENVMFIDLTQMGLDITDPSEFASLFSKPYYDYCQGAMLSFGGRNVKFNQLVQNGNFASTDSWAVRGTNTSFTVSNNVASITVGAQWGGINQDLLSPVNQSHKFLAITDIKGTTDNYISIGGMNSYVTQNNVWQRLYIELSSASSQWLALTIGDRRSSGWTEFNVKNAMLIDLTEMFGVGNEPSESGFKELFPNDYYEYNVGQYMNLGQPVGLKTVGKNLLNVTESGSKNRVTITIENGEVIINGTPNASSAFIIGKVWLFANNTYTLSGCPSNGGSGKFAMSFYDDENLSHILATDFGDGVSYTPTVNGYYYVAIRYWYNYTLNSIVFKPQVEKGSVVTEFEVFTESTLSIPLDEFPDGMDGINDVRDEKNETGYKKKIGFVVVDGSDDEYWGFQSGTPNQCYHRMVVSANLNNPPSISNYANRVTMYASLTGISYIIYSGELRISDMNGAITDVASLRAWLQAHPLVVAYALQEPLENYSVVDLGTLNWHTGGTNTSGIVRMESSDLCSVIKKPSAGNVPARILCNIYETNSADNTYTKNGAISLNTAGDIDVYDSNYNTSDKVSAFKQAMSGVYLLYEKENSEGFTTATLVTENGEVALANENGILVGKCNSDVSADAGFIEGKIKLSDEDGDVYSNKIQIHVERSPQ